MREVEKRILHRMANVYDIVEMWQGCLNLHATPMELHAQNKQLTDIEYISDSGEIVNASWSTFQCHGASVL